MLLIAITITTVPNNLKVQANSGKGQNSPLDSYILVERGVSWNKYYNSSTGEYILESYYGDINYLDENKTWKPINTTIIDTEKTISGRKYKYGITEASYHAFFRENISTINDRPIAFYNGSYAITLDPMDYLNFSEGTQVRSKKQATGIVEYNSIKYPSLYDVGIDLLFSCRDYGVKSVLIIDDFNRFPSPEDENCTLNYKERVHAFEIVDGKENHSVGIVYGKDKTRFKDFDEWDDNEITTHESIYFQDEYNETVFYIPELYAWDSNSNRSMILLNKTLHMTHLGNLWIEIHVPYSWLSHTNRMYPVYIDPTLSLYSTTSDGYIYNSNTNYNAAWTSSTGTVADTSSYIYIGQKKELAIPIKYHIYRAFLFFNTSSLPSNVNITNATLSIYKHSDQSSTDFDIVVRNGQPTYPRDPLQTGDYNKSLYSGNGGSFNTSGFSDGYNNISLTNYSWIDTNGTTKLCLQSSRDINGTTPFSGEYVVVRSRNYPDYNTQPKCTITYSIIDFEAPSVNINFAGNLSESGGPSWRPPGETDILDEAGEGIWRDGYYTNDSRQQEDWMYINLTVVDKPTTTDYESSGVSQVWLQWLNETTWTNWTNAFTNTDDDYWEFNTSGNISTQAGYNYSFNIVANDTIGNSDTVWWNKTGIGGVYTRRFVQLDCSQTNISYTPFYLVNYTSGTGNPPTYGENDVAKKDRLHHDQGPDGTLNDSGYLSYYDMTLDDTMHLTYCGGFVGYFFEDSKCIEPFEIKNIYYHIWSACSSGKLKVYWHKIRGVPYGGSGGNDLVDFTYAIDNRSSIYWDNSLEYWSDTYYLCTSFRNSTAVERNFTDNDIYEFILLADADGNKPSVICNRSIITFVLFNVPDNTTLNATDSDNDNLTDLEELYETYTSPFLADTDNDGVSDRDEVDAGTNPNNYTDY